MADRVGFSLGGPDGLLSHFLSQPLHDFHQWYEEALLEFPDEFDAARLELLKKVIRQGSSAIKFAHPKHVNFLVLDYYSTYANINNLLYSLHDYWDKLVVQEKLINCFKKQEQSSMVTLLTYTVMGRLPLPDPIQTVIAWQDYGLSFWIAEEVMMLNHTLNSMTTHQLERLTDDADVQHALKTTREALKIGGLRSTGIIIFVGW